MEIVKDEVNMKIQYFMLDEDENEVQFILPAKFEVCSRCNGKGKHVNPNVDCHGISQEEFDNDPDFREAYFSGRYDVECYDCGGKRVILSLDCDSLSEKDRENLKLVEDYEKEEAAYEAMCRAERMFGA